VCVDDPGIWQPLVEVQAYWPGQEELLVVVGISHPLVEVQAYWPGQEEPLDPLEPLLDPLEPLETQNPRIKIAPAGQPLEPVPPVGKPHWEAVVQKTWSSSACAIPRLPRPSAPAARMKDRDKI